MAVKASVLHRIWKFRIYPNKEQEKTLREWEDSLRMLWNLANEQYFLARSRYKRDDRVRVSAYGQARELTDLRAIDPRLNAVPRLACADILGSLEKAWKSYFKRQGGKPKFKSRHNSSMSIYAAAIHGNQFVGNKLKFNKLGLIPAVVNKQPYGKPSSFRILRDIDQWFVAVTYAVPTSKPVDRHLPAVGIDRGVVNAVADSDGRIFVNPRFADAVTSRLVRAQRQLAKKQKGSKNRDKAKLKVAKLHRKIRRQREVMVHTQSLYYAERYDVVALEKLNIEGMTKKGKGAGKRGLNRSILQTGWYAFEQALKYKLEERGGDIIHCNPAYTSQRCNKCGYIDANNRSTQSEFRCLKCGHKDHADINGAKNILRSATEKSPVAASRGAHNSGPMKEELYVHGNTDVTSTMQTGE